MKLTKKGMQVFIKQSDYSFVTGIAFLIKNKTCLQNIQKDQKENFSTSVNSCPYWEIKGTKLPCHITGNTARANFGFWPTPVWPVIWCDLTHL